MVFQMGLRVFKLWISYSCSCPLSQFNVGFHSFYFMAAAGPGVVLDRPQSLRSMCSEGDMDDSFGGSESDEDKECVLIPQP